MDRYDSGGLKFNFFNPYVNPFSARQRMKPLPVILATLPRVLATLPRANTKRLIRTRSSKTNIILNWTDEKNTTKKILDTLIGIGFDLEIERMFFFSFACFPKKDCSFYCSMLPFLYPGNPVHSLSPCNILYKLFFFFGSSVYELAKPDSCSC